MGEAAAFDRPPCSRSGCLREGQAVSLPPFHMLCSVQVSYRDGVSARANEVALSFTTK
jgi:hypothetical protein